ncbi:unnamed protein product [Angiostrongylus costaricensis]|uniref:PKD_channel domain-containing protein n=1 Tax=Angiostrongylus costaricensis TaxID=334426 RepID=A0A158PKY9_ANGCS|nr:unnamed protein product [Angiostrongylus costaricensis]
MDGVRHLKANDPLSRLSYITGARILNRRARANKGSIKSISGKPKTVFEEVLEKAWDMDAVRFLRSAAHWKSRMILGCTWPNGTSCRLSDFKPVWTLSGLCWAINTNPDGALEVVGSGVDHALRLLLNVETYERIDACTNHFRTNSIPGLKVLMYNQTDIPLNSHNGVNVPAGYSVDIRFRMQYHRRLPGDHCITETEEYSGEGRQQFDSASNLRTCKLRRTLREIEYECECSMARAFTQEPVEKHEGCTVDDYFGCVKGVIERAMARGLRRVCLPSCESVEYIAMQDLNRLPQNLMPALIEGSEQEDEDEVDQDEIDEDVSYIKRNAHRAFEKQARYQEDIFLRTKRRIARLRAAVNNVSLLEWGWHGNDFTGVFARLSSQAECFSDISSQHFAISAGLKNRPTVSEERRASQVFYLVDRTAHRLNPKQYKTVADIKRIYGDQVEVALRQIYDVVEVVDKLWRIFSPSTFMTVLRANSGSLTPEFRVTFQYETGKLQRRAWAEKMQSRQMRHFFDDEFTEGWYQPILQDLEYSLYKVIIEMENEYWPRFKYHMQNGTATKLDTQILRFHVPLCRQRNWFNVYVLCDSEVATPECPQFTVPNITSLLVFDEISSEKETLLRLLINSLYNCTVGDVKEVAIETLRGFKRLYRELQSSYANLFKKELPDYLENFEFGDKFVSMERCYKCMASCCDTCESPSMKASYADPGVGAQQSIEERQKTSWLNHLPYSNSPTYSTSQTSLNDDPIEQYLDTLDVHRPPKYELLPGVSNHSSSFSEKDQASNRITDKNNGLKSNAPGRPHTGWFPKPTLQSSSWKHKSAKDPSKSLSRRPSYLIPQQISLEDEENNSQMTDSLSTPTPKLFVGEVERQTTI